MISLTQQERDKFTAWLEQEAKSDNIMVTQALKLSSGKIVAKHIRQRVVLFFMMTNELRKIEDMSVGG